MLFSCCFLYFWRNKYNLSVCLCLFFTVPTDSLSLSSFKKLTSILVTIALVPHFVSYYKKYTGSNKIYLYYLLARASTPLFFLLVSSLARSPNILFFFILFCKKYKRVFTIWYIIEKDGREMVASIMRLFFLSFFFAPHAAFACLLCLFLF